VADLDPARRHDITQITQGQSVAQPAEHNKGNNVARQAGSVQHATATLVKLAHGDTAPPPKAHLTQHLTEPHLADGEARVYREPR
jgi:hypothetical protein